MCKFSNIIQHLHRTGNFWDKLFLKLHFSQKQAKNSPFYAKKMKPGKTVTWFYKKPWSFIFIKSVKSSQKVDLNEEFVNTHFFYGKILPCVHFFFFIKHEIENFVVNFLFTFCLFSRNEKKKNRNRYQVYKKVNYLFGKRRDETNKNTTTKNYLQMPGGGC